MYKVYFFINTDIPRQVGDIFEHTVSPSDFQLKTEHKVQFLKGLSWGLLLSGWGGRNLKDFFVKKLKLHLSSIIIKL